MTEEQRNNLSKEHELFLIEDEKKQIHDLTDASWMNEIEGIVCNFFFLYHDLAILPKLRFIQLTSVGTERVPVDRIKEEGIYLFTAGTSYAVPMAEWAICKTLEIYKNSVFFYKNQEKKIWEKNREILELSGKKAAVIGFGNVGQNIARRLKAFDVTVYAVDIVKDASGLSDRWYHIRDIRMALKEADIIFVNLPINRETYHLFDREMISIIKKNAVMINVSRGQVIDENALIASLECGKFYGVALDVFEEEPLCTDNRLWDFERVLISPHNSFVGDGNINRMFETLIGNLDRFRENRHYRIYG